MAMKQKHLATLYSRTGFNAVSRANQIYTELRALPLIERLQAARDLPNVFTEAIIIDHGDAASESAARARLKSHFYVNSILDLDRVFHRCKIAIKQAREWFIDHIQNPSKLLRKTFAPVQSPVFQGDSSPVEARSLPSEIEVMLKTILAAHAPTAAKERSSLQSISI
jgi:hypothetical protein